MSNKITFKSWLANLGKGLWQAICWVGRCLNPKYKTPFWRVIWSVLTICVIVCTCIITRVWYQAEREQLNRFGEKQRISKQFVFMKPSHSDKLEKARVFDPFGRAGLTPLGKIRLTLADEIKMTPVEASAGEFFCSFETPCPGTVGINLKNYRI